MKAKTVISKIRDDGTCSIAKAELLTKALHREGLLPLNQAVRFRPLDCTFDIVNADLFDTGIFVSELCSNYTMCLNDLEKQFIE